MIEFEWDSRNLPFGRGDKRVEKALQRALRMAGNAAIKEAQDGSTEYVTTRKLIGQDDVRQGLPLEMPSAKAEISDLQWTERVSGKGMALAKFPYMQTALGARVRVNARSGFKLLPGSFTLRLASGHVGIFRRTGKDRLPIKELWTTRISDSMSDPGAVEGVQGKALEKLQTAFARGLERELTKLRLKGEA